MAPTTLSDRVSTPTFIICYEKSFEIHHFVVGRLLGTASNLLELCLLEKVTIITRNYLMVRDQLNPCAKDE